MFCKPILEVRHRLFGKPGAVDGVLESRDKDIYALRKLAFERDFHDLLERTPYLKTVLTRIENNVVTAAWRSKSGQNDALVSNNRDNNAAERMNGVLKTSSAHQLFPFPEKIKLFEDMYRAQNTHVYLKALVVKNSVLHNFSFGKVSPAKPL